MDSSSTMACLLRSSLIEIPSLLVPSGKHSRSVTGQKQRMSTAFHPQTDSNRGVRTVRWSKCSELHRSCNGRSGRLSRPSGVRIQQQVYTRALGSNPSLLCYGRHPRVPASLVRRGAEDSQVSSVQAFIERMETVRARAKEHLLIARQRQKAAADQHRREVQFSCR